MSSNTEIKSANIITLGCSKNLVDSEFLLKQLHANNINVVFDTNDYKDLVIINTCGFILDAKQESIDTIMEWSQAKAQNKIKKLFVIGCLSERYKDELTEEIPEVDEIFGVNSIDEILKRLKLGFNNEYEQERILTTPSHYAFLKIAEGCDRTCSFCAIPIIRGKYISRKIEDLYEESKILVKNGVKELILIAQDVTYYGTDIYKRQAITELVEKLSSVKGISRIRIHYTYPVKFPKELIGLMKEKDIICNYLDIPIQHANNKVLKMMRRGHTRKDIKELVNYIRQEIPDITIRSTLLVGHPGEGDEEFQDLIDFVKEMRFDRLGVFTYSEEDDTYSALNYKDSVPDTIKQQRADKIMQVQNIISKELNKEKIGAQMQVIIDRREGDYYIARSQYDSPEVDNEILIKDTQELTIGNIYSVKIIDSEDYDLYGEV